MRFMPSFLKLRENAEGAAAALPGLMIHAEKLADSVLHGDHARRKSGAGEKFWQYREYVPGDRPQDIDWRQSGKTDEVFIKQKEWQITRKSFFWCNISPSMEYKSDAAIMNKRDYARILTLASAMILQRQNEQIGVFGQTQTGRSDQMIETLGQALFARSDAAPLPASMHAHLPQQAYVFMIGDFLAPLEEIAAAFEALAQRTQNAVVVQILDPAECDIPYTGRVEFSDSARQHKNMINNVGDIRAQYQARMEDHCAGVKTLSRRNQWSHARITSDTPLSAAMQSLYRALEHTGGVR